MNRSPSKNSAELWVTSEALTPQEIGAYIGIEPDGVWERGKPGRPNGPYAWKVLAPLDRKEPMEAQVEHLLARVSPFVARIWALSEYNDVVLICAAYLYSHEERNPGLYLDRQTLDTIQTLGATLSYEAYFLAE